MIKGDVNMEEVRSYTIDLTTIDGRGEFRCPKCGTRISPDDQTEKVYTIVETLTKEDSLESILLQCNKCGSQIQLVGFEVLNSTEQQFKPI
jgi:predicted RNA-binding Zn-ribbon protein involved in translation (DUF1610 family)